MQTGKDIHGSFVSWQRNKSYFEKVFLLDRETIIFLVIIWSIGLLMIMSIIGHSIIRTQRKKEIARKIAEINSLTDTASEITPQEFFNIKRSLGQKIVFPGVYIINNVTKNKPYVGQSKNVLQRVQSHFTGHGNGDVYADYKYGDQFTIKMLDFTKTDFQSLNELERYCIKVCKAYEKGYNKTQGNT